MKKCLFFVAITCFPSLCVNESFAQTKTIAGVVKDAEETRSTGGSKIQKNVEMIHASWTSDKEYRAAPTQGKLATLDNAIIVTPPKGMEKGYVPIVTRQEAQ